MSPTNCLLLGMHEELHKCFNVNTVMCIAEAHKRTPTVVISMNEYFVQGAVLTQSVFANDSIC